MILDTVLKKKVLWNSEPKLKKKKFTDYPQQLEIMRREEGWVGRY
jgi:hypothetical protein